MSVEDPRPRFMVVCDGRGCFWTETEEEAEAIRQDARQKLFAHASAEAEELGLPSEVDVEPISDPGYCCLTHKGTQLLYRSDGWMTCPDCTRPPY